jgi:hypothetical protein|tara:strand:+ start:535 stop:1323 length:789 start_codon:yes stop_codon:yes gene_type:complete
MVAKLVERCGIAVLCTQVAILVVIQGQIVDPWHVPITVVFTLITLLGAVGVGLGLVMITKSLVYREPFRLELLLVCVLMCIMFLFMQFTYGWQNIDYKRGNDYSTDIVNLPQYKLTKYERLHVKETSSLWSFMDIPHSIVKADTDSIVLPLSALESKIVLNQATAALDWMLIRYTTNISDGINSSENYEFLAGNPELSQRTDLLVRIVSTEAGSSVIDIRSSSPGRRRDLGFNAFMIRKIAGEIAVKASQYEELKLTLGRGK